MWGAGFAVALGVLWFVAAHLNEAPMWSRFVAVSNIVVFGAVFVYVRKGSVFAAAAGLFIYVIQETYFAITSSGGSVLIRITVVLFLVHGFRGTMGRRRLLSDAAVVRTDESS